MDKNAIIKYIELQQEVNDLHKRIESLEKAIQKIEEGESVVDVVSGGYGGIQHFKVEGVPTKEYSVKKTRLRQLKGMYEFMAQEETEAMIQAEEYIKAIEEPALRMIFRYRFLDGLSWEKVAMNMNYRFPNKKIAYTEDSCRKRCERFLDKNL